jgi:hypothetical protein
MGGTVMTFQKNLGLLLAGIFLIIYGLSAFIAMDLGKVPQIVALVAGVLLVLAR